MGRIDGGGLHPLPVRLGHRRQLAVLGLGGALRLALVPAHHLGVLLLVVRVFRQRHGVVAQRVGRLLELVEGRLLERERGRRGRQRRARRLRDCPRRRRGRPGCRPPFLRISRSRSVSRRRRVSSRMRGTSSAPASWDSARRRNPPFSKRPSGRRGGSFASVASSGCSVAPEASAPLVPLGAGVLVSWGRSTGTWSGDSVQPPASAVVVGRSTTATSAFHVDTATTSRL